MAKYIGPKTKVARKFGEAIYGVDKSLEKKNYIRRVNGKRCGRW